MKWLCGSVLMILAMWPSSAVSAALPQMNVSPTYLQYGSVFPGATQSLFISIQETSGSENLTGISISTSGSAAAWVTVTPSYISRIDPGQSKQVRVTLNVPSEAPYGSYGWTVGVAAHGQPSIAIPASFDVPVILAVNPGSIQVTTPQDQKKSFELSVSNICNTASVYDIRFSTDSNIVRWLVLPSVISSLGPSQVANRSVEVRVPEGEPEPIGKYSGILSVQYRNGPASGVSAPVTVKIIPPEQWFKGKNYQIDSIKASARVYQTTEPYKKEEELITTKQALNSVVNLVREDPAGFYTTTGPFLDHSIELYNKVVNDLLSAYEAYLNKQGPLSSAIEVLGALRNGLSILKSDVDREGRTQHKSEMLTVQGKLESIIATWENKVGAEKSTTEERAQKEEQEAESDLRQAQGTQLLCTAHDYYLSGKAKFASASSLYYQIGFGAASMRCKERADYCDAQAQAKQAEINKTINVADTESKAGDDSYDRAPKAYALNDSSNLFQLAKEHYVTAALEYRKLGTIEHDSQAKQCEDKAKASDDSKFTLDRLIGELSAEAANKFSQAENAFQKGQASLFPVGSLSSYRMSKALYQEAQDLYNKQGGDAALRKVQEIPTKIQDIESKVRGEQIELAVYVSLFLALLVVGGLRYLHMMSIKVEIERDRKLFREQA